MDKELDNEDEDIENEEEIDSDDGEEDNEETESEEGDEDEEEIEFSEDDDEEQPRANKRIRELNDRARNATEREAALQRELEELRTLTQTQRNGVSNREREEYLSSLSEDDRRLFLLQEQIQQSNYQVQMIEFNAQDRADKASFEAKVESNPLYKRFAPEVEKRLQDLRNKNKMNAPREDILKYLIGDRVLKQKVKPVTKNAAANRVKKQKVKPSNSGSNVSADRNSGDSRTQRNKRLDNYRF